MSARPQITITLGRNRQVVKRGRSTTDGNSDYSPSSEGKRTISERLGSNMDNSHSYGSQTKSKRQRTDNSNWSLGDDYLNDDKKYAFNRQVGRNDLRFKLIHKGLSKESKGDLREKLSRNNHVPSRYEEQELVPESRSSGLARRVPSSRSVDDLLQLDSLRKPYSSWTLDGLRRRSPDRLLGASRGMSPPRIYGELRHVPVIRSVDTSRSRSFITNGVVDASRPRTLISKPNISVDATKPILRAPPPGGTIPKSSYTSEEPLNVASLLNSLGLGKYAILFQAEEVDMTALKQMGDSDLKELGIPMGPRKKILLAVSAHSRQRHR